MMELDAKRHVKQQSYILGPHQSQENWLGSIKEESQHQALLRGSSDSHVMQALLQACDDGVGANFNDIAENPETREFILYLQQVQPDLLLRQGTSYATKELAPELTRKTTMQHSASEEQPRGSPPPLLGEGRDFKDTLRNKKSSKDVTSKHAVTTSPKGSKDHLVEVMTAYRGDPAQQVIIEETIGENCVRSSLGHDIVDTERHRVNSTHILNSQETLPAQSPGSEGAREPEESSIKRVVKRQSSKLLPTRPLPAD